MTDRATTTATNSVMSPFDKWQLLSKQWMNVQSPAAPSESDAANYLRLLGEGVTGRVLILGCTPTLRRVLSTAARELICADISPGMMSRSAAVFARRTNESFVATDWLDLPFEDAAVDAVVGDKVFDNVPPSLWEQWLAGIARVMKPGACFATRISPRGRQALKVPSPASYEVLVQRWANLVTAQKADLEEACSGFWEDSLASSTAPHSAQVGDQRISRILPRTKRACLDPFDADTMEHALVELVLDRYWSARDATWTAYSLEGVISTAAPWFAVSAMLLAHDYAESQRQPTLGLERRRS